MKAIDSEVIRACHDLSEGGLAVAASEMAFSGGYGIELDLRSLPLQNVDRDDFALFSESNSRFLVEASQEADQDFRNLFTGSLFAPVGRVTRTKELCIHGLKGNVVVHLPLKDLEKSWKGTSDVEA
jgi:phosphoribosylformylglycinamidine synthase